MILINIGRFRYFMIALFEYVLSNLMYIIFNTVFSLHCFHWHILSYEKHGIYFFWSYDLVHGS